jgi:hypothetical protein
VRLHFLYSSTYGETNLVNSAACNCTTTYKICDFTTGQCLCPPLTTGRQCEVCAANAWKWDAVLGCEVGLSPLLFSACIIVMAMSTGLQLRSDRVSESAVQHADRHLFMQARSDGCQVRPVLGRIHGILQQRMRCLWLRRRRQRLRCLQQNDWTVHMQGGGRAKNKKRRSNLRVHLKLD